MGSFLLNELGEVLLEFQSRMNLGTDLCLEINEISQTAVLRSDKGKIAIDFVHQELIPALKMRRYLLVVERNDQFFLGKSQLSKVVFVE